MNYRSLVLPGLLVLSTIALTRYYWPRQVTKTVVTEHETVRKDIRTVVRVVERKDGTKETVTEVVDHSKETIKRRNEVAQLLPPNWLVSATAVQDIYNPRLAPAIGVHIQRRVLGPFFAGLLVNGRPEIGLSIGMEF